MLVFYLKESPNPNPNILPRFKGNSNSNRNSAGARTLGCEKMM